MVYGGFSRESPPELQAVPELKTFWMEEHKKQDRHNHPTGTGVVSSSSCFNEVQRGPQLWFSGFQKSTSQAVGLSGLAESAGRCQRNGLGVRLLSKRQTAEADMAKPMEKTQLAFSQGRRSTLHTARACLSAAMLVDKLQVLRLGL